MTYTSPSHKFSPIRILTSLYASLLQFVTPNYIFTSHTSTFHISLTQIPTWTHPNKINKIYNTYLAGTQLALSSDGEENRRETHLIRIPNLVVAKLGVITNYQQLPNWNHSLN